MSDLLAQLVARTLTSAPPAIRPRLEPLFANAPAIDEHVVETIAPPLPTGTPTPLGQGAAPPQRASSIPPPPSSESPDGKTGPVVEEDAVVLENAHNETPTDAAQLKKRQPATSFTARAQKQPSKREDELIVRPQETARVKTSRHVASVGAPASIHFEKDESVSKAPIVRVTIGRIDVRAAPAPAPSSRKETRRTPPALTLEAYLNSRKGGAR
jgi:hypothetical protein